MVVAAFAGATGAFGNQSLFDRLKSGDPSVAGENLQGRDQLVAAGRSATSTHLLQVTDAAAGAPATVAAVQEGRGGHQPDRRRRVRRRAPAGADRARQPRGQDPAADQR